MQINQATLAQFFSGTGANSTSSSSADVLAKVSKAMESKNTVAPKLNAALAHDNTKLSALGKLMNGLTTFQSIAQSFSGTAATPTTQTDPAQLKTKITALVDGFNGLNATLSGLRKGDLKSDAALAGVRNQLSAVFSGGAGSASSIALNNIGITAQADGTWAIDAKKLQSAINADPTGVSNLFSNGGKGIADNLTSSIKNMVSGTGSIEQERTALNKDIASLNTKRSALEKTLTTQAQALAKIYSMQSGSTGASSGRSSLLDMIG